MSLNEYNYTQQATKPEWFGSQEINASAESGSSPFNEWYGFNSNNGRSTRQSALETIRETFSSQTFTDNFISIGFEIYHVDDTREITGGRKTTEEPEFEPVHDAIPATIAELIFAESRF